MNAKDAGNKTIDVKDSSGLDALSKEDMQLPFYEQMCDISVLRLLYEANPLKRSKPNDGLIYPWLALAIAEKHALSSPVWAVKAVMKVAKKTVCNIHSAKVSINSTAVILAEKDIRYMRAIFAYIRELRDPIEVTFVSRKKPTPMDLEAAYMAHISILKIELEQLLAIKSRAPEQSKRITNLRKKIEKSTDEKDIISRRIARKFDIDHKTFKKLYYDLSPSKKSDAKKQSSFSFYTLLPNPFSG